MSCEDTIRTVFMIPIKITGFITFILSLLWKELFVTDQYKHIWFSMAGRFVSRLKRFLPLCLPNQPLIFTPKVNGGLPLWFSRPVQTPRIAHKISHERVIFFYCLFALKQNSALNFQEPSKKGSAWEKNFVFDK